MQSTNVSLWLCDDQAVQDPRVLASYRDWLSGAERERYERFRFAALRHQFLVSRALLRWVLAQYTGLSPASLTFAANAWGKPHLDVSNTTVPLFNLSHTTGLIVLAVTETTSETAPLMLGVDVERLDRVVDASKLAVRYFSPLESETLCALPTEQQRASFFNFWTLKEAYIKAVGMGLAIPLDAFSFILEESGIDVRFTGSRSEDEPSAWQFRRLFYADAPGETEHQLGLALRDGGPLQLHAMAGAPLLGFEPVELSPLPLSASCSAAP